MRLLLISKNFLDPTDAQAQQSLALAVALADSGVEVDVIVGAMGSSVFKSEGRRAINVYELPARWPTRSQDVLSKVARKLGKSWAACVATKWARQAARLAEKMIGQERYDAIISIALPIESHISAMRVKREIPWIACLSDPWPESLLPEPYSDFSLPFMSFFQRKVVANTFDEADAVVLTCVGARDYLKFYYPGLVNKKVFVIPHVAPPCFSSGSREEKVEKKYIIHAGSLSRERVCMELAEAISVLPDSSGLYFKFIGDIHPDMLKAFEATNTMHRIEVHEWGEKNEVLRSVSLAHASLLVEARMTSYPFLPSKLADYAAAGRPVIAITGMDSPSAKLIAKHNAGFLANHDMKSILMAFEAVEESLVDVSTSALWESFCAENIALEYIKLVGTLKCS